MQLHTQKLITCILPKGVALEMAKKLKSEYQIMTSDIKTARGVGKITPTAYRRLGVQTEKELLTVVVPAEKADEVFEYIYYEANINEPHGGMMYIYALNHATRFELPEVPDEE